MLAKTIMSIAAYEGIKKGAEFVAKEVKEMAVAKEMKAANDLKHVKEVVKAADMMNNHASSKVFDKFARPEPTNLLEKYAKASKPETTNLIEKYTGKEVAAAKAAKPIATSPLLQQHIEKHAKKDSGTNVLENMLKKKEEAKLRDTSFAGPPAATEARAPHRPLSKSEMLGGHEDRFGGPPHITPKEYARMCKIAESRSSFKKNAR